MKSKTIVILLGWVLLVLNGCVDEAAREAGRHTMNRADSVLMYVERIGAYGYSGSFAYRDGNSVRAGAFGLASADGDNEHATLYYIGSIAKQFVAASILNLVQQDKLALGDSLGTFYRGLTPPVSGIMISEVLRHRAGFVRNYHDNKAQLQRQDVIAWLVEQELLFEPGAGFSYSNLGYVLLVDVVERVSGQPFHEYLEKNMLQPHGLESTYTIDHPAVENRKVALGTGAELEEFNLHPDPRAWLHSALRIGPGGILSTPEDLIAWIDAVENGDVLNDSLLARMFNPGDGFYAMGWIVVPTQSRGWLRTHDGAFPGHSAVVRWYPESNEVIAVTMNQEKVAAEIAAKALQFTSAGDVRLPPVLVTNGDAGLPGTYGLGADNFMTIRSSNTSLKLQAEGPLARGLLTYPEMELPPLSRFAQIRSEMTIVMQSDEECARNQLTAALPQEWTCDDLLEFATDGDISIEAVGMQPADSSVVVLLSNSNSSDNYLEVEIDTTNRITSVGTDEQLLTNLDAFPVHDGWAAYDVHSAREIRFSFTTEQDVIFQSGTGTTTLKHSDSFRP